MMRRRSFLRFGGMAAGVACCSATGISGAPAVQRAASNKMRPRPDLLDAGSPKGLEVFQITVEPDLSGAHLYMEAQIFTLDSRRFLLHRSATAHGGGRSDPRHQYFVCDLEDGGSLAPVIPEIGGVAPSVSPDGRYVYYFIDETKPGLGRFFLKRVNIDGSDRQTVLTVDGPLPGTRFRASRLYPISTISSDGKRLAISAFLGDGKTDDADFGLMVFDLERASVRLVLHGPTWCNMHSQYSRSTEGDAAHDILIQENHGCSIDAAGVIKKLTGGEGADIHVIRDDGTHFRNMPWGRDGNEFCQGHQCWRGRTDWAITSTGTRSPRGSFLIEGKAAPHAGHVGLKTPGALRNDLTRDLKEARFSHFAGDAAGKRFVSDAGPFDKGGQILAAEFGEPGRDALGGWRYLLNPRSTCKKESHIHPFLSPDGTMAFFNSDESGILHAYMMRGF